MGWDSVNDFVGALPKPLWLLARRSVWGHKVYTIYSILSLVFVILIIVTAFITIALTYFQLAVEDHRWCLPVLAGPRAPTDPAPACAAPGGTSALSARVCPALYMSSGASCAKHAAVHGQLRAWAVATTPGLSCWPTGGGGHSCVAGLQVGNDSVALIALLPRLETP